MFGLSSVVLTFKPNYTIMNNLLLSLKLKELLWFSFQ